MYPPNDPVSPYDYSHGQHFHCGFGVFPLWPSLDADLMRHNPLCVLHGIIGFAAFYEVQLRNMVKARIDHGLVSFGVDNKIPLLSLRFTTHLLQKHLTNSLEYIHPRSAHAHRTAEIR